MLVVRRLVTLVAFVAPVVAPALGGSSDAVRRAPIEPKAVATRAVAAAQHMDEPVTLWSPGHGPHTGFKPSGSPRELLLSFDDGPDLRGTPVILNELDRRGLKAIFFVTGWRLLGNRPEDVARRDLV